MVNKQRIWTVVLLPRPLMIVFAERVGVVTRRILENYRGGRNLEIQKIKNGRGKRERESKSAEQYAHAES